MKKLTLFGIDSSLFEQIHQIYRKPVPRSLFFLLCFNLILAPTVQATTGNEFSRTQAYALGILGLVTIALAIYLFVVMFQPERF